MLVRQVVVVVLAALAACANNVPQDRATATDGRIKGATPIVLQDGAGRATGIVTYPGGDRIDWKLVELPAKLHGDLDVKLTWSTPRPGLRLAFDVFDAYNKKVASSPTRGGRTREVRVANAHGKYAIRVYAVGRGDAGRYTLEVAFADSSTEPDWTKVAVPEPPPLLELPPVTTTVKVECDLYNADYKNPECRKVCPTSPPPPPRWPGCADECTVTPMDAGIPACAKKMKCDVRAPDRRIPDCAGKFPPCPDPRNPDPANPRCDNIEIPPVRARITRVSLVGDELVVQIGAAGAGIDKTWTAEVLRGGDARQPPDGDKLLAGGRLRITKIDQSAIEATVKVNQVTKEQLDANKWVLLRAPPRKNQP